MDRNTSSNYHAEPVQFQAEGVTLEGDLAVPANLRGIVIFAHGSGSSRFSPRNRRVAEYLNQQGIGTLLVDLLTAQEEAVDMYTRHLRFNINLLAGRLANATDWLVSYRGVSPQPIGYFGASTGAAAALVAATERPAIVRAVVSRGGRPDLAEPVLDRVHAPTLLIVGGEDDLVIGLNQEAFQKLHAEKQLEIIPGATHLFEEPGTLEEVSRLAADWFNKYLVPEPVQTKS